MDAEAGVELTDERRSEIASRLSWGWRDWYVNVLNRQSADWDAVALEFFEQASEELLAENGRLEAANAHLRECDAEILGLRLRGVDRERREFLAERTQILAELEAAREARNRAGLNERRAVVATLRELEADLASAHATLDEAGVPRETTTGPWPLERRVRCLLAWWQESRGVAELNPELLAERERLRDLLDALVTEDLERLPAAEGERG